MVAGSIDPPSLIVARGCLDRHNICRGPGPCWLEILGRLGTLHPLEDKKREMARGNDRYWEITFDPDDEEPTISVTLSELTGITGWENRKIVGQGQSPSQIKMREKDPQKRFEKCHFALDVSNSSFSNSYFCRCTFEDSTWVNVKFSKCTFEECHFARVFFNRCQFLNSCKSSKITASAELFRVEGTSLSSSSFLGALTTNIEYLPSNTTKEYQFYRLRGTKEKLAKLIYESTKSEADIDFYFEAFKELILAMLDAKVEYHRFKPLTSRPRKKNPWVFYALSFPYRVERGIVKLSGSFSDWGRSIFRPMLFFLIVVIFFSMLYYALAFRFEPSSLPEQLSKSAIAALNVTLVAGYTAFFNSDQPLLLQACEGVNLLLGLFWYSLIVPTVTRKILR
jgi:hypothetical protein